MEREARMAALGISLHGRTPKIDDYLAEAMKEAKGTNLRIVTKLNGAGDVVNWKVLRSYGGRLVPCGSRSSEKGLYQLVMACKGSKATVKDDSPESEDVSP